MRENTDQNNFEYGHFLRSTAITFGSFEIYLKFPNFLRFYFECWGNSWDSSYTKSVIRHLSWSYLGRAKRYQNVLKRCWPWPSPNSLLILSEFKWIYKFLFSQKSSDQKTCGFSDTAQKMKFSIKDFFSKCDQIRRNLQNWSHLLKKSLMENFIFCAENYWMVQNIPVFQLSFFGIMLSNTQYQPQHKTSSH